MILKSMLENSPIALVALPLLALAGYAAAAVLAALGRRLRRRGPQGH